jgi:hypothetical protein
MAQIAQFSGFQVEVVPVSGSEPTSVRGSQAASSARDAINQAQEAISLVAASTAEMIGRSVGAARPDRVEVKFGLKFSAQGGVIMAGEADGAALKVTLEYNTARIAAAAPQSVPRI